MTENANGNKDMIVNVPIPALAGVLLLAAAGAAYTYWQRDNMPSPGDAIKSVAPKPGFGRRIALRTAISMIENDTSRKLLLVVLKTLVKRV